MKISFQWLQELLQPGTAADRILSSDIVAVREKLPMLGLGVESARQLATPDEQNDWILDLEVTANRPDCLGHLGVARQLAAAFDIPLNFRPARVPECASDAASAVSIKIADPDGCWRYCGRVIRNLTVGPSPVWMARRLEAVGVRSINNVADITNYVLMELGHPMHAFDLAKLAGPEVIVRRALPGETLKTLDGVERNLAGEDLVIADAERPVGLAGVMGGEASEIGPATRDVFLESAWFEPVGVRRTSKRHGLHTEASHRFERGADVEMARLAIDRAAAMIAEICGGEVLAGVIDVYPVRFEAPEIGLWQSEIHRILGAEVWPLEIDRHLRALGFTVRLEIDGWRVTPPSFRLDVKRQIDVIEEIACLHGYDRLPSRVRPAPALVEHDARREKELALASTLVALGYHEIIAPTMVDPEEDAGFTADEPVRLLNPLSRDTSAMRSSAVPGMLRAIRWNLDRGQGDVRFFEFGKTYTSSSKTSEGLPTERRVLTLGLSGARRPAGIHDSSPAVGFLDLKGDLEILWDLFEFTATFGHSDAHYLNPAGAGRYDVAAAELARFGEIAPEVAREEKLREAVYVAEIDLDRLLSHTLRHRTFKPFSKFPAVERDFSLLVPAEISFQQIEQALVGLGAANLQDLRAVDRFEGGALPAGHYSLLLRGTWQSPERTLTSEEVDAAALEVTEALKPLGIRVRGT